MPALYVRSCEHGIVCNLTKSAVCLLHTSIKNIIILYLFITNFPRINASQLFQHRETFRHRKQNPNPKKFYWLPYS